MPIFSQSTHYTLFTIWPFLSICSKFVASAMLNTIKIVIKLAMVKKIELLCHCEEGCVEDSFVLHDSQKWNHQTNYRFLKVFTIKSSNCTKERITKHSFMLDRKHSDPDKNRLSNEIFFDYNPMVSQQFLKKN